jgi:two-component system phosphate regulon response regulator PhoB
MSDFNTSRRILVVDDEPAILELVSYNLRAHGYKVEIAATGQKALSHALRDPPDLILLDLMMPELPGLTVAQRLRENELTRDVPIIMLTARSENLDQLAGFRAGADDYITKPFSMELLIARVDAVLRRSSGTTASDTDGHLSLGPVRVDMATFQAWNEDELLQLTATEFRILAGLVASNGRVLSRRDLIGAAMGPGVTITERTIDVHVTAIRRKLGEQADIIRTVRGVGYRAVHEPIDADSSNTMD